MLAKEQLEQNVIVELLKVDASLLEMVRERLRSAVLRSSVHGVSIADCASAIERLDSIYGEHMSTDMVDVYFTQLIKKLAQNKDPSQEDMECALHAFEFVAQRVPRYYVRDNNIRQLEDFYKVIENIITTHATKPEMVIRLYNAITSLATKAEPLSVYICNHSTEILAKISPECMANHVQNTLKYLESTHYIFDFFATNRFYHQNYALMRENRQNHHRILSYALKHMLKNSATYVPTLRAILSSKYYNFSAGFDELSYSVNKKERVSSEFRNVLTFVRSQVAEAMKLPKQPLSALTSLLELVRNWVIARPAQLPIVPEDAVSAMLKLSSEKDISEMLPALSAYVEIVFSPCMDDIVYYKNARKVLVASGISGYLNKLFFGPGAPLCGVKYLDKHMRYLAPIHRLIGKKDDISHFLNNFREFPPAILSSIDGSGLRQLLLLCIDNPVLLRP